MNAKFYVDPTVYCGNGHMMYRKDRSWGPHGAGIWTCCNPDCENYKILFAVPFQVVEGLAVGVCDNPGGPTLHDGPYCTHEERQKE